MSEYIVGRGGSSSGSSSRAAIEDPNTLRSKSFAQGVDLLGEGEWEEVCVGGLKGLYLDDTVVETADGIKNFSGITIETRSGTVDQARLSVAGTSTESSTAVGIEMKYNQPVTVTVAGESIDYIRAVVAVSALNQTNTSTGDINGTSVSYKIEYNSADNTTWRTVPNSDSSTFSPVSYLENTDYTGYNLYEIQFTVFPASWYVDNSEGGFERTAPCYYQYQISEDAGVTWKTLRSDTVSENTVVSHTYETTTGTSIRFRILTSTPASFNVEGTQIRASYSAVSDFLVGTYAVNTGIQVIEGKTTTSYEREHAFRVYGDSPFGVRITRLTADSTSSYLVNATVFQSITTVVEEKFTYPFSVLVGWSVDATQFSSIPSRSFMCKMSRIKIPSNYDPIERTYSGLWDGSFKIAWSDNPAWCFRDLITNTRYGLGQRVTEDMVDDAALYQIAKYCDEYVPNGSGGYEPRFTCNLILQDQAEAWQVISDMASIFNGITYWSNGTIIPVQDSPKEASYAFNNTNVIGGEFTYAGSNRDTRYNAVYVTWNDPTDMYRQAVEFVSDDDLITSMGYLNATSVTAFGCISRGQATRVGKWYIYSNNLETESVTFVAALEGMVPVPGEIIKISDTLRSSTRLGGRIVSVDGTTVTLDKEIEFDLARQYTVGVILANGKLEDRTFNHSGSSSMIEIDSAFSEDVAKNSIYVISDDNVPEKLFRVLSVTDKGDWTFQITAATYNPTKYDYIEKDEPLGGTIPEYVAVGNITTVETKELLYSDGVSIKNKLIVSWQAPKKAVRYDLYVKAPDGTRKDAVGISDLSYELLDVQIGEYQISITPINVLGQKGAAYTKAVTVYGKSAPPSNVTGVAVRSYNGQGLATWDEHPDLDVKVGGKIVIKYTSKTSNVQWEDGVIVAVASGSSTQAVIPLMSGTYTFKAVDEGGRYSSGFASTSSLYATTESTNVVAELIESPDFSGVKDRVRVENGILRFVAEVLWDDKTGEIDDWDNIDYLGSDLSAGTYYFHDVIDLTGVYTVRVSGEVNGYTAMLKDTISSRISPVNTWDRFNGDKIDNSTISLLVSTTNDDPSSSQAVWSEWEELIVADYTARGFKFKLVCKVESTDHEIYVSYLKASVDAVDRVVGKDNVQVGTDGFSVVFDGQFSVTPAIAISIDELQTGDYYRLTSKSATGFTARIYDSTGTPVARQIDWIAKGYGRKIS